MVSRFIAKYPVVKTMGAYFCINVAADFTEQIFVKKRSKETYDRGKTARIAATCTFVTSPMLFVWIRFIDKFIPGKTALTVAKKVLADAFVFAPTVISTFYITTNVLEKQKDVTAEWKQKFFPTWTTGLCYWPFVQAVNFAVIPMKYKTCLYMPTASFIWMNYLCFMKDQKIIQIEEEENEPQVQSTTHESKTYALSAILVSQVPSVTQISQPQKLVQTDEQTAFYENIQCSQTLKEKELSGHDGQHSGVNQKCHISKTCSEPESSQHSWLQTHSDVFHPLVILSLY